MKIITLGRGSDNNIVLNEPNISRHHLQIVQNDNGMITVVDLGSTNGTYVNGRRIASETSLNPGDELRASGTIVPWQSYFAAAPVYPQYAPSPMVEQADDNNGNSGKKTMWIIIIVAAVVVTAATIASILILRSNSTDDSNNNEQTVESTSVTDGGNTNTGLSENDPLLDAYRKKLQMTNEELEAAKAELNRMKKENARQRTSTKTTTQTTTQTNTTTNKPTTPTPNKPSTSEQPATNTATPSATTSDKPAPTDKEKDDQAKAAAEKQAKEEKKLDAAFDGYMTNLNAKWRAVAKKIGVTADSEKNARAAIKKKYKDSNISDKKNIIEAIRKVYKVS